MCTPIGTAIDTGITVVSEWCGGDACSVAVAGWSDSVWAVTGDSTVANGARSIVAEAGNGGPVVDALIEMSMWIMSGVSGAGDLSNSELVSCAGDLSGGYSASGYADVAGVACVTVDEGCG